jgi:HAD superfamily hydrolase (TIGR01509 family)
VTEKHALLLDLDGTLADSLRVLRDVYDRFLALFGHVGDDAEFNALNGPPLAEVVRALKERRSLGPQLEDLLDTYRGLLEQAYAAVPPALGAEGLLRNARSAGWATVVVTSAPSTLARTWLRAAGIDDLVDAIVGGEMVARGKPHPDPYLAALHAVGASADRSLAIEDSRQGVAAAVAAGVPTLLYRPAHAGDPDLAKAPGLQGVVERLDDVVSRLT